MTTDNMFKTLKKMATVFQNYSCVVITGRIQQKIHTKFLVLFIIIYFSEIHSSINTLTVQGTHRSTGFSSTFLERSVIPEIMIHASNTIIHNLDMYPVIKSITATHKTPEIYNNVTNLPVRVTNKQLNNTT